VSLFDVCCQLIHEFGVRQRGLTINGPIRIESGWLPDCHRVACRKRLPEGVKELPFKLGLRWLLIQCASCGHHCTFFFLPASAGRPVGSMKAKNNLATVTCCRRTKGTGDILNIADHKSNCWLTMVVTAELSRAFGSDDFEAITSSR
jgi:hypothetical protein